MDLPHPKTTPGLPPRWPWPDVVAMTAHTGSGQWRKRYAGRDYYFGALDDPRAALAEWRRRWPVITGEESAAPIERATAVLSTITTAFLESKMAAVQAGELSIATLKKYEFDVRQIIACLGPRCVVDRLRPADFVRLRASQKVGVYRLADFVVNVRHLFGWAREAGLIEAEPNYGPDFRGPSMRARRQHRASIGERHLQPAEIRKLLDAAEPKMKAAILLGINAGLGNTDVATLPTSAIKKDWLVSTRSKTGVQRKAWLWPETVEALLKIAGAKTVFESGWITPHDDFLGSDFTALAKSVGVDARFYDLRRTFRTWAAEKGDDPAAKVIMGHAGDQMDEHYVQRFPLQRLRAVGAHIRRRLRLQPGASSQEERAGDADESKQERSSDAASRSPSPRRHASAASSRGHGQQARG